MLRTRPSGVPGKAVEVRTVTVRTTETVTVPSTVTFELPVTVTVTVKKPG